MDPHDPPEQNLHATTVAYSARPDAPPAGLLIVGRAGSGKSSLALQLMALGAQLVADDRTVLRLDAGGIMARAPEALRGLIEARHIGILNATALAEAPICAIIDMDHAETHRMPPQRSYEMMGISLPCLYRSDNPAWPAAVLHYLKAGKADV